MTVIESRRDASGVYTDMPTTRLRRLYQAECRMVNVTSGQSRQRARRLQVIADVLAARGEDVCLAEPRTAQPVRQLR